MAFNGSGVFNRIYNWVNDANNAINITASRVDTEDTGFATGLSNCICKDGQTTVTADLPMATFKHLNVGNSVLRTQYAAAGQVQDGVLNYLGTSGGTSTAYTLTPTLAIPAYAAGQVFTFLSGGQGAGGATTMNISGLGTKAIKKNSPSGGGLVALSIADIANGQIYAIAYDGTQFELLNPSSLVGGAFQSSGTTTQTANFFMGFDLNAAHQVSYQIASGKSGSIASGANASITYVNAFSTTVYAVLVSATDATGSVITLSATATTTAITIYNTSAFTVNPASYIVIGY